MKSLLEDFLKISKEHLFVLTMLALYLHLFVDQSTKGDWVWPVVIISILTISGLMTIISLLYLPISPLGQRIQNLKSVFYYNIYFSLVIIISAGISFTFVELSALEQVLISFACLPLASRIIILLTDYSNYTYNLFENIKKMVNFSSKLWKILLIVSVAILLCYLHWSDLISEIVFVTAALILTDFVQPILVRACR